MTTNMKDFNIGDTVECVRVPIHHKKHFTLGKIYEIEPYINSNRRVLPSIILDDGGPYDPNNFNIRPNFKLVSVEEFFR